MKLPPAPHSWRLSPRQAIAIQKRLAGFVSAANPHQEFRFIAGLDAAFSAEDQRCFSAVILWDIKERKVVEQQTATRKLAFPYIPGLLSFREAPVLLAVLRKLKRVPDALLCDGQGLAHPRRFGIACHIGILCGLPAIGCAKSRLIGTHEEPPGTRGSTAPLWHKDQLIGTVLRTQTSTKPVYVSIGHQVDLPYAERVVLECAVKYRLPEPVRLADQLVAAAKNNWKSGKGTTGLRTDNRPRGGGKSVEC